MIFPVKCLSVSDMGRSEYFINVTSECIKKPSDACCVTLYERHLILMMSMEMLWRTLIIVILLLVGCCVFESALFHLPLNKFAKVWTTQAATSRIAVPLVAT